MRFTFRLPLLAALFATIACCYNLLSKRHPFIRRFTRFYIIVADERPSTESRSISMNVSPPMRTMLDGIQLHNVHQIGDIPPAYGTTTTAYKTSSSIPHDFNNLLGEVIVRADRLSNFFGYLPDLLKLNVDSGQIRFVKRLLLGNHAILKLLNEP